MTIRSTTAPEVPSTITFPCLLLHKPTGSIILATGWNDHSTIVGSVFTTLPKGNKGVGTYWPSLAQPGNYDLYSGPVTLENVQ